MAVVPLTDTEDSTKVQPLVWVVVLHYQAPEETALCLKSLQQLEYDNLKVLLIDNGSPDKSAEAVAKRFPEFDYLRLEENLGFAGGCNAGVTYCVERGASWVWLLNNDATASRDALKLLMAEAARNDRAGLLGGQIYTPRNGDAKASLQEMHEDQFVPEGAGTLDFNRGKSLLRRQIKPEDGASSCQWISGCNLLLRTEAFLGIGGFDEDYFLYFEDTDLCYRMHKAGWDCILVPSARVEHIGGKSTEGKLTTWRSYYYTRNRLLFFMRHTPAANKLVMMASIFGHLARHALVLRFRGERGKRQLKAEMLGLRDWMQNRFGKADCLDW